MAHPSDEQPLPLAAGEHPPVPGAIKVASVDMADVHHSTRTKARNAALEILFEADLRELDPADVLAGRQDNPDVHVRDFTQEIVLGVRDNADDIDRLISESASAQWPIERMPRVDRCLARMAMWELNFTDIKTGPAISEALELADELSTADSKAFLNGLLGKAAQSRLGGEKTDDQA